MSDREATLELVFRARNLADAAVKDLTGGLEKVAGKASDVAGRVTGAFSKLGGGLANAIGNSVENLAQGGSLGPTLLAAGAYMAGQIAEEFGGQMIEKLASSSLVSAIAAPLGALGSTAGSIIAAAVPVGMALLPAILVAALVAAIAVLIVNGEIRGRVVSFVGGIVSTIGGALSKGLAILPQLVGTAFGAAWSFIVNQVVPFIAQLVTLWLSLPFRLAGLGLSILRTIVDGLAGLPGRIAAIVLDAFRSLRIDVGPFHISAAGIRIDAPDLSGFRIPGFAGGVTNFGGGLARVGERGPEIVRLPRGSDVIPNGAGAGAAGGVRIVGIDERELLDMVARGLYFRLKWASPTSGPI